MSKSLWFLILLLDLHIETLKHETMQNVNLKMNDLLNDSIVERTIDISNAMTSGSVCWELGNKETQKEGLERWISERGNDQHETILELVSWSFN